MQKFSLALAALAILLVCSFLHYHPGYLSRPQVGTDVADLENWLNKHGYIKLEGRSAGPDLYEGTLEVINDEQNFAKWNVRKSENTLFFVHRFFREQGLCGAGQYFVHWRPDKENSKIAEIIYQDTSCYI